MTTGHPPHGRHPLLEDLFGEQAALTPGSVAVIDGDVRLTYAELHHRASRMASALRARGVERETLVATAFPRSADAVVCMLAVVLAGGAYLPVNPEFPGERLRMMLQDSGAALLVCAPGTEDVLAPGLPDGLPVLSTRELLAADHDAGPEQVAPAPLLDDRSPLAYVMFTSGSTGRPKGVMIEQAGIVRLVRDSDFYRFTPQDRLLLTGALEFDAATFEIWGCLLNGATLCIVPAETLLVAQALKEAIREQAVSVMWMTAPLFHQTVDTDPDVFAGLGTVVVGGDVLSARHVNAARAAHPALRVINGYGPTENTTFTTTHEVRPDEPGPFPIGRPVAGTTVLVLGPSGAPAAPGEQGELLTGGTGLARGYLGNPELTAERFITLEGERYYRTGDLVSTDAQGLLHFHGRVDDQVKIRGHRVEVKEVESVLLSCPGVRDACVTVVSDDAGKHLVAHVVAQEATTVAGIAEQLAARLPAYLCPDHFVAMDRLPLNANGKVDKAALPPARPDAAVRGRPAPALPEALHPLAELWDDVLHLNGRPLTAEDDFFALGGNSLAVGALVGRLAVRDGIRMPYREVFAHRTLASMAEAVREHAAGSAAAPAGGPIERGPAGVPVPLHPQQHGMHTHAQVAPESPAYHIPLRLDLDGPVTPADIRAAVTELVRRHDALRTRLLSTPDGPRQDVLPAVSPDFTVSDTATHPDDESVLATFVRPFDLRTAPLLRALLVPVSASSHRLYLDVHHIVFDGVSLRILAEELTDLLAGAALPEPKRGYADASRWYAARLEQGAFASDERYWLETLADPPLLDLPTDHPRPAVRAEVGTVHRLRLPQERAEAVDRVAARTSTTSYAVLLTAYTAALMGLSGQRDVVVGTPMSGRTHPDVETLVGMFVNTAALRLTVPEGATLTDLLLVAHTRHQEALDHQSYPFDRVVAGLRPERDPSRLPVIEAFFALQNIGFHRFARGRVRTEVHLLHAGACRFDLNLQVHQRPDGTVLELEYSTALFSTASAQYLLHRVVELVDDLDRAPHTPLSGRVEQSRIPAPSAQADFTF
ncbi:non-ribosomal peptide synthetase [Streptomyces somaliensis]|uniref:Amino acid adenylation domain-containing protein n=1 Tax=Streptomyces somaliensis (strain ATCC 33201 / DSM 40738 / JCM 12659 / KCTC 9044 / NCTC 11332 / NRRL B-12077 / IP 733) TaxID=1134445 RepID=A0AA44DBQ1_STRE0|nr:non-ribosomal peptide synthetase [Streptomyces somaliensis]NKY13301.1 amino acid adenylation domain-containing protein [Streptomyces somaliensis DSM 40738]